MRSAIPTLESDGRRLHETDETCKVNSGGTMRNAISTEERYEADHVLQDDNPDLRLGEVAPGLAHEAMNIAQALIGLASICDDRNVRDRASVLSARVEQLGRHLIQYARAGDFALREVDPRRVVAKALTTAAARVEMVEPVTECRYAVLGDEARLALALSYLIMHLALRARAGATVEVSLCADCDDVITFQVTAPLAAVPITPAPPVFVPFTDRAAGETGLELAIAQMVARSHGGLTSASRVGDRLVLILTVPATRLEPRWEPRSSS
jgi:signal transduction histidine kinase